MDQSKNLQSQFTLVDITKYKKNQEKAKQRLIFERFQREAEDLELCILNMLQDSTLDQYYKKKSDDPNKQKVFESSSNSIVVLDNIGLQLLMHNHSQSAYIEKQLEDLHRSWQQLLLNLEKQRVGAEITKEKH